MRTLWRQNLTSTSGISYFRLQCSTKQYFFSWFTKVKCFSSSAHYFKMWLRLSISCLPLNIIQIAVNRQETSQDIEKSNCRYWFTKRHGAGITQQARQYHWRTWIGDISVRLFRLHLDMAIFPIKYQGFTLKYKIKNLPMFNHYHTPMNKKSQTFKSQARKLRSYFMKNMLPIFIWTQDG